jgi:hypothetical protein
MLLVVAYIPPWNESLLKSDLNLWSCLRNPYPGKSYWYIVWGKRRYPPKAIKARVV